MDAGRILKFVVAIAVAVALVKYGVPWAKGLGRRGGEPSSASGTGSCARSAERASEAWGGGLRNFVNPPYDAAAWSSFRSSVESRIDAAEANCDCTLESCQKARGAMRDLRGLVNDLDSTVRNNTPPDDLVGRQERIDNAISEAAELARAGK